jgi:alcohol dehydrogenase
METRAAVLTQSPAARPYAETRPLTLETLRLDPPGDGEILVRLAAAGLCHSDLSVINGDRPRPLPMALGHEAAGTVEQVGRGVTDLAPGDHVVMVFVPSCGGCAPCQEGRAALCEPGAAANNAGTLLGGGLRLHRADGSEVKHHIGVAGFAERAVVSRRSAVKIDPDVPFDVAALFGCAVLTGVGAAVNTAKVRPGESVAVIGLGGVGLSAVMGARAAGAAEVIAVDIAEDKLAFAERVGATACIKADDADAVDRIRAAGGKGVHHAIETAGVNAAFDLAYAVTCRGGQTVTASLANPANKVAIQHVNLVAEERTVRGSYLGGGVPSRDIPRAIALWRQGRLPVEQLKTGESGLDEINAGFDALAEGRTVRHVLRLG